MIAIGFDQSEVAKSLHKHTDSRPGRAYHLRQFFMGNLKFNADAARVLLAHGAGQSQQRLAQPLLAIHRHQIGDDLPLVANTQRQITLEAFNQPIAA